MKFFCCLLDTDGVSIHDVFKQNKKICFTFKYKPCEDLKFENIILMVRHLTEFTSAWKLLHQLL